MSDRSSMIRHGKARRAWPRVGLVTLVATLLGASIAPAQTSLETVVDVRIHGNHSTPDAVILEISGLAIGTPANDDIIDEADRRLRESDRFAAVEIRKRFASIADPSRISGITFALRENAAL